MYSVVLEYVMNDKQESFTFEAKECHINVNGEISQCHVILSSVTDEFMDFITHKYKIEKITFFDGQGNVAYTSTYWNCLDGLTIQLTENNNSEYYNVFFKHN